MKQREAGEYFITFTITFNGTASRRVMKEIRDVIRKAITGLSLVLPISSIVGKVEKRGDDDA